MTRIKKSNVCLCGQRKIRGGRDMLIIYMFSIKTVFKNAIQSYRGSRCFKDITQYILETARKKMKQRDVTQGQNQKKK